MTPRQLAAYMHFATKREIAERMTKLSLVALASQGDGKAIKKQLADWDKLL